MTRLYGFFVRRPLLVNLFVVLFVATGVLALWRMNFDTFPAIDLGLVKVTTYRPGAGPEDVELSITVPLEEEILKVDGLDKVTSNSMEAMSAILVRLSPDVKDKARVMADLQKAVDRAATRLPDDLPEKPLVEELSSTRVPVMEVHVSGPVPEETLRFTARQLENGFREVEGVSGVEKVGYRKREVRILLKPDRLHRLGISFAEIADAISRRNVRDTGGSLESFVAEKKVLTVGQFDYPKEVEEVILRAAGPGDYVRVRDVADVVLGYENWKVQSRTDGVLGVSLQVRKKAEADGLRTARAVRKYVEQARKNAPPGVTLIIVNDISRFTCDMLAVLTNNAAVGLLLVLAVLLIFCDLRLAFWVAFGLPVAICITFTLMQMFGMGINFMTLTGLILVLGMLIDDAIVTGESIYRLQEEGMAPADACIQGTATISRPVIMSTVTTVLAFSPAAFLGGYEGKFLWALPVMALLTLGGSLLECQFMLPPHLAHGTGGPPKPKRWFTHVQRWYDGFVLRAVRHRYLTILLFVAASLAIVAWGRAVMRFNLYPEMDIDVFNFKVELPEGTSFPQTSAKVRELEEMVRDSDIVTTGDLLNINVRVGHHDTNIYGVTEGRNTAWALVTVYLRPQGQREVNTNTVIAELRQRVKELEGYNSIIIEPMDDAPIMGKPVELEIIGNDPSRFELAEILVNYLNSYDGATDVTTSYKPGKDVVKLELRHEALADRGLAVADVVRAVRVAFDGEVIDELQTIDEKIEYRLQFEPQEQGRMETLRDLTVINRHGLPVSLRGVARLEERAGEAAIKRYFGERTLTVYADIDSSKVSAGQINADLARFIEEQGLLQRYDRLRLWFGGELEQQQESLGDMGTSFLVCFLGIFLLLVVVFNSFTQPLLIMAVIPFGFTGVIVGFGLQGLDLSFVALIGILGLGGVLVNDSLVMIDSLNQKKRRTGSRFLADEDIADRARLRLRPIVITSVTTVAGLAPAAYGLGGSNPFMTPIVMAMVWGVAFGTFVTLVLLPCLYAVDQDVKRLLGRLVGRSE